MKHFKRITVAFSILLNTIFGGANNQTLSARNWERKRQGKIHFVWFIDRFFWWEKDHCLDSWTKWMIINEAIRQYDLKFGFDSHTRKHWYE